VYNCAGQDIIFLPYHNAEMLNPILLEHTNLCISKSVVFISATGIYQLINNNNENKIATKTVTTTTTTIIIYTISQFYYSENM
jgi:sulfur relay (sulfurtransferase) DsrF/TusC family protein